MKFLKWLVIVVLILAGIVLFVPVFLPSVATITDEKEVKVSPAQVFQNAALYTDRDKWDPWLTMEPEAKVTILPKKGYIGSTYAWEGDKIGSGKMRVDSVHYPDFIGSSIWFGPSPEPSQVYWILEESGSGTKITWKFISEGAYPFGRLMLVFMKGALQKSFETGLDNLHKYLESNPPRMYKLSEIKMDESYDTEAMVIPIEGTMEDIGNQMMEKFPLLFQAIQAQGLAENGPAFAHYLDFDEATGFSHALLAIPVKTRGKAAGEVKPRFYPKTAAVTANHIGEYAYFKESYDTMGRYIMENELEVTGEAYEVYLKTMMDSKNPMDWVTVIAFPLK
ncbi:MAG: SRPBCC family protein [Bacteroidales bacterium]|jgi:effector-binding domain-containing protein|nr:SRPBCC family protein [Bacteroidales bacterium]